MATTILDLPLDCFNEITSRLKFKPILHLMMTCNFLYHNLKIKYIKTNKQIPNNLYPYLENIIGVDQFYTDYKFLKSLTIKPRYPYHEVYLNNLPKLEKLIRHDNIQVDISTFTNLTTLECGQWPKGIEKLNIQNMSLCYLTYQAIDTNHIYPTVKKLSLGQSIGIQNSKISNYFPNLSELSITAKHMDYIDLSGLNLYALTLHHDFGHPNINHLTNLKKLEISGLQSNLNGFTNLIQLDIYDSDIQNISFQAMTHLTSLSLYNCSFDTTPILPQSIIKLKIDYFDEQLLSYKNLKKLDISTYDNSINPDILSKLQINTLIWSRNTGFINLTNFKNCYLTQLDINHINIEELDCPNLDKLYLGEWSTISKIIINKLSELQISVRLSHEIKNRSFDHEIILPEFIKNINIDLLNIDVFYVINHTIMRCQKVIDPLKYPNIKKIKYYKTNY